MTPLERLATWMLEEEKSGKKLAVSDIREKIRSLVKNEERSEMNIFYILGKTYGTSVPFKEVYDEQYSKGKFRR
jgi:hypothetical protein